MPKLFIVLLGGNVAGCHVEMHDVRFVVADTIKAAYPQLKKEWVGTPESVHIDAYTHLDAADGFEIALKPVPQDSSERLYFVNLGGYHPDHFAESHQCGFFVAKSPEQAKQRALDSLLFGKEQRHKDDLMAVDDCLELTAIGAYYLWLTPCPGTRPFTPDWYGYDPEVSKA
jgi:hypothetical protein